MLNTETSGFIPQSAQRMPSVRCVYSRKILEDYSQEKIKSGEFPGGAVVETALSLPWAWVQSVVRELRSHKLHSAAKK